MKNLFENIYHESNDPYIEGEFFEAYIDPTNKNYWLVCDKASEFEVAIVEGNRDDAARELKKWEALGRPATREEYLDI